MRYATPYDGLRNEKVGNEQQQARYLRPAPFLPRLQQVEQVSLSPSQHEQQKF
jgi:hypothetical protein